ncbi:toll-like receptor 4 [Saccostrea echinata]|uniref:toll-like receptor 4 n=1 Tax=Saccostrea echinata TaxID=191078 RepID=UPI002A7ED019|nr:toll-like receptor 4 [Saccostrea echinata]
METLTGIIFMLCLNAIDKVVAIHKQTKCRYTVETDGLSVNCSGLQMHSIPDFCNNNTPEVDLTIPPSEIVNLDLSNNVINRIVQDPFHCLFNLQVLNLKNNKINFSSFNESLFSPLVSLRQLNLKYNGFVNSMVFAELLSLEVLRMDASSENEFGDSFAFLKSLHTLDLSGRTGKCDLRHIKNTTFENLLYLKVLDLSSCMIKYIDKGTFSLFQNLTELYLSYNQELGFQVLQNITFNLKYTKIERLHLDNIRCFMGPGTTLCREHLSELTQTSLEDLNLAGNRLEWMEMGVLKGLPKTLEKLSLAYNRLSTGMYSFEYSLLTSLKEIDLSHQLNPPSIISKIFQSCNENQDKLICSTEYVSNSFLKSERFEKNSGLIISFIFPPKLEVLHWESSRLYGSLLRFGIKAKSLRSIYMQNNIWYKWIGPLYGFENVTTVDFSMNFCNNISTEFLTYFSNIRILNMSGNYLGKSLSLDYSGQTFKNQLYLEVLDLSINSIDNLHSDIFANASNINILIISGNRLYKWDVKIDHMWNLTFLDLSDNRLTSFESTAIQHLEYLFNKGNQNITVDLANNRLSCTCKNINFLLWLTSYKSHFKDIDNYTCLEDSSPLQQSLDMLIKNCKSYLIWYIVGSISCTLLISLTTSYLIYSNRWKIRYLKYIANKKLRGYHRLQSCCSGDFEFDAYVSYAIKDLSFVKNEMIPNIEEQSDIRLAIMQRDMEPCGDHATNIMDYISRSKRTLCVVSKDYLVSDWQDYELNMARMEGISSRKTLKFVYLILMPDVCQSKYPRKARDFIKKGCFIEYPDDPLGNRVFWESLRKEIQKDINRWRIRYIRYMASKKLRGYRPLRSSSSGGDFEYDAYISYSVKDLAFVKNELIPNLEGKCENSIRLAILHRDMVPCGDHANVCKSKYPQKARDFIKKGYYIEYPEGTPGQSVFWERLGKVIKKDLQSTI